MKRIFFFIGNIYNASLVVCNYVSVILIFLMSLLVSADVIGRYLLNRPIPGTTELVKCTIIVIVFFGIPYTLQKKRHIRTTIFLTRMPPMGKLLFELTASLMCAVVFSLIIIFAWQAAWEAFLVREYDGVQLKVPVYPARFVIVIGSILFVIQSLIDLVSHVREIIGSYRR